MTPVQASSRNAPLRPAYRGHARLRLESDARPSLEAAMGPARATLLALVLATAAAPVHADGPEAYALDPVHTRVLFAVSHAGFSQALGTVSGSTGALLFDPDDWRSARLEVNVPLARLDLGDADWNEAVRAGNLLDTGNHPQARFVSTSVEPRDERHATVCGDLTLRDVTRPLCLEVTFNQLRRHPMPPFRRTAGFSATATVRRSDYGIDAWRSMIGDEVELRIEAEAVRDRDAAERFDARPPGDEPPAQDASASPVDVPQDQSVPEFPLEGDDEATPPRHR